MLYVCVRLKRRCLRSKKEKYAHKHSDPKISTHFGQNLQAKHEGQTTHAQGT